MAAQSSSHATRVETSWDSVAGWYDELQGEKGSDHYENVILPGALRLLRPEPGTRVLDVACGQGILCRRLAELGVAVTGVEASPRLLEAAKARTGAMAGSHRPVEYLVADARELGPLGLSDIDSAACIMALSNIEPLEPVIRGIAAALKPGGSLVIVISHPAFRAPGQTGWGWDERAGRQFRRIDGYLSPGQTPIDMHPGKRARGEPGGEAVTMTFHRPIQAYVRALAEAGLLVESIEEWPGQRVSTSGPRAAEENRARREIPLFLGMRAVKR
jgi:ubiquinone/menaquinone biosynthesis C-methylase UbiE